MVKLKNLHYIQHRIIREYSAVYAKDSNDKHLNAMHVRLAELSQEHGSDRE